MSKKHKGQVIRIADVEYPVVSTFTVLRKGWEMDNVGYIVKNGVLLAAVLTSHGRPYLAERHELRDLLDDHEKAFTEMRDAYAQVFLP